MTEQVEKICSQRVSLFSSNVRLTLIKQSIGEKERFTSKRRSTVLLFYNYSN